MQLEGGIARGIAVRSQSRMSRLIGLLSGVLSTAGCGVLAIPGEATDAVDAWRDRTGETDPCRYDAMQHCVGGSAAGAACGRNCAILLGQLLEIAQNDAAKMGMQVEYRQEDMRQISFTEAFDRVLILFGTFGFFEDDENLQVLKNVARALKPGGLLAFDTVNRDVALKGLSPFKVIEKDDNLMVRYSSLDMLTGRWNSQRIVIRNGVKKLKPSSRRLYNATEIRDLLGLAGLKVYRICGTWDARPLSPDLKSMIVIAQKPTDAS